MVVSQTITAGPIPAPELLAGYEHVCPGTAERIVRMAEVEGQHRRDLESRAMNAQIEAMRRTFWEARLGQVFAFLISLGFIGSGTYLVTHGQVIAGSVVSSVGLASIVSAFILGRTRNINEEPKREATAPKKK